jgi:pseudouridine-5'-phosphate glycosidase
MYTLFVLGLILAMDIGVDLELGQTPVAAICSGAKAILDLGRTLEYLETKVVTVTTLGDEGIDIPAFYSGDSAVRVSYAGNVTKRRHRSTRLQLKMLCN